MTITHDAFALGRTLQNAGLLKPEDVAALIEQCQKNSTTFIEEIVKSKRYSYLDVAAFTSDRFHLPLVDLSAIDETMLPLDGIDKKLIGKHRFIPLGIRARRALVAVSDPLSAKEAIDTLRFQKNLSAVDLVIAEENKISALSGRIAENAAESLKALAGDDDFSDLSVIDENTEDSDASALAEEIGDAPVVKFIQKMLIDAINEGASDIHFEPYEKYYRVRYRTDGILREVANPPLVSKDKIASRIKVISRLNIAEKRVPQDGRTKLVLSKNRAIDFRVSTLPTLHGEKIVMRILDPTSATLGIDALGYEAEQKKHLLEAISRPYGMVLVTGPTGSGKTVSLYTCINILNQPGINISTAEDPAEINLAGINQVNVDDRAGLTFSAALKSFLRQDPDIIMVGEIRDLETAEIAIKAAQTGHMVMSTLHTNDAPQTLTRLLNMGVPAFNVATAVSLITAQRLARRLCTCKKPIHIPEESLLQAGFTPEQIAEKPTFYTHNGCERCHGSGYKGRVGIYQVMPITEEMQRIIMSNGTSIDISDQAKREGIKNLRESGLLKVLQGMTSLDEVLTTTNL